MIFFSNLEKLYDYYVSFIHPYDEDSVQLIFNLSLQICFI